MSKEYGIEDIRSDDLQKEYEKLQSKLMEIHEGHIEMALRSGFALEAAISAKNNLATISNNLGEHPEYGPIISSAYTQVVSLNYALQNLDTVFLEDIEGMTKISSSLMTTCSTSGSIVRTFDADFNYRLDTPSFLKPESDFIYKQLVKLSQPLARTYEEIEQVYYATNADNTRAALSMIRQAFDHFFAIVAPDDDVRLSEFWEEKTLEDNPSLVTRRERMNYAIATRIQNQENAESLTNNIDLIVKSYKVLNELHNRGELNEESARQALLSVKYFLEEFASYLR